MRALPRRACSRRRPVRRSEPLPDHFLALGPQRFGAFRIERIGADAAARVWIFLQFGDMTILAIFAANRVRGCDKARPDRGGRALRNRLPLEGRRAGGLVRLFDALDHVLDQLWRHMTAEL